ncbi:MAG: hypothetical protein OXL34_14795 [Gemmatimonadota bacterium]|nr:hypothetical protein [Gemmatimonadota bacterium]
MMNVTRVGGAPWFVAALLVTGAVAAPGMQAQEAELRVDSTEVKERPLSVSLGLRLEFWEVTSPGASLQVTLTPGRLWFSLGFLAQMVRWNVRYDPYTLRDHAYLGRLSAGVGTGEGPSLFLFYEKGTGVVKTHLETRRRRGWTGGSTYGLSGIGLGTGYTAGRVTATLDLSLGVSSSPIESPSDPFGANNESLYGLFGASVRFRLF